jgi:hypothetical protein
MIILQKENYAVLYTLDYETKELYYAPIYEGNVVNLSEFAPVDLNDVDDTVEIQNIQKELISLNK